MSGMQRALEKAEREGRLAWTQPGLTATLPPPEEPAPAPAPTMRSHSLRDTPPVAELRVRRTVDSIDGKMSPLFVVVHDPASAAAEEYRLLHMRVEAADHGRRIQLLTVTSPRLGEGKTTTSANLALTMAREFQRRVVLVEADLRRPVLASMFGLPPGPGLSEVLLGSATLDDAMVMLPDDHVYVLAAGTAAARSLELVSSHGMQRVLETLRSRFDRIVVDSPPVTLADAHVLARLADGVLLVVRAGVTTRPAIESALAGLDRQRLLGIVVNEVEGQIEAYRYAPTPLAE